MAEPLGTAMQAQAFAGAESAWPMSPAEWETRASQVLERAPFDYIAGGAGEESTMRANREAFDSWRLRPRMLVGTAVRDPSVTVLGTRSLAPFLLAPIGVQTIAHPEGELAVARAAAATGVPLVVSTASSISMEAIAAAMGDAPRWFQLYWVNDREIVLSLIQRAEASGHSVLVLTVDTLTLGWRERDLRNRYLPFLDGEGIGQFTSDPIFRSRLNIRPEDDPHGAAAAMVGMFPNLSLNWQDLDWLRQHTQLPILAKGILRADDARRAVEAGLQGVIVSNHGGRQVDGAVAALDALPEVRSALDSQAIVMMDSGIRRAPDVIKAIALGADAVFLGRPYMYGLAVGGQAGVEQVIRMLMAEIDLTMALVGARTVRDVDRSSVVHHLAGSRD